MEGEQFIKISGKVDNQRIESRVLEEKIQAAVAQGYRGIEVKAFGQHGIGGRLWKAGGEPVTVRIDEYPGQRVGSLGFPNTVIEVMGSASDDTGWLNAGATIIVHGNATNGAANAMAQGKIYVAGNIGARGMTMTKRNPRFDPPELWILGSAGDYFGEFMAGGTAVICGLDPQNPENVLGHRPFVGMVGGKAFFRGPQKGYSQADARMAPISDQEWDWLCRNLKEYLAAIGRTEAYTQLAERDQWQLIVARTPREKMAVSRRSMDSFRRDVWDVELGQGGLIGDLTTQERGTVPLITTGELRRYIPVWENDKYTAPCEASCPSGIPVQRRWQLIREGFLDESVDMVLGYTPFPATVCGYLCPSPCMQACTRGIQSMVPLDIASLGKASINASLPEVPEVSGKKVAVIGGGPAGISIAWQLRLSGHTAVVYDMSETLGGKMKSVIPGSRIPAEVLAAELERAAKIIPHVHLQQELTREDVERLRADYDFIVVAAGASKPRTLPVSGKERMIPALDFLAAAKKGAPKPGKRVVIIGAGNVGCDAATEASRYGAQEITMIDVQKPAAFGKEREDAEAIGATFRWPCFTKEITAEGVVLQDGELLPADTVIVSIGDAPDLAFLPESVVVEGGFVAVNARFQTSDADIFAVGDVVRPGLLTDAVGAGREAALAITAILDGRMSAEDEQGMIDKREMIDKSRMELAYFDARQTDFGDLETCGSSCSSCGACRDCGICVSICPQAAISRKEELDGGFVYRVDEERCIGCGFCGGACPCGIWALVENAPLD